jgi:transcriptional regulator GlxA family with amidase domain
MRELAYWLLTGPSGGDVASAVLGVDCSERVIAAIHLLRARFAETIRVGELAATARMSASAFHRTFKTMTSLTPLQYQKQLRLLEARNLMLAEAANAETAAYRVGYESPSQFSREYARMFGAPPHRDMATAKTECNRLDEVESLGLYSIAQAAVENRPNTVM